MSSIVRGLAKNGGGIDGVNSSVNALDHRVRIYCGTYCNSLKFGINLRFSSSKSRLNVSRIRGAVELANLVIHAAHRILRKHVDNARTHSHASWLKRFGCSLTVARSEIDHDGLYFGYRDDEGRTQVLNSR
jgi:hypothetical protein